MALLMILGKQNRSKTAANIKKPLIEHLQEIRNRLIICLLSLFVGALLGYFLKDKILFILLKPLGQPLFYTSPAGGLDFIFSICLLFGIIFTTPVFVYHIFRFIEPIFPPHPKSLVFQFLIFSWLLLFAGVGFAYFVSLPAALHFFNQFSSNQVQSLISTGEYLSFVSFYLAGFGLLFQLPLILLIINRVNKLDVGWLFKQLRIVIILSFIIGAILTPDPINQAIMALPLILLYLFSTVLVWLINSKKNGFAKKLSFD